MAQPEIAEELSAGLGQRIQPTYGYYRRRDGTIGIATITQLERLAYIEQGWQHLAEYGAFDLSPYVANHPLEGLFMFGGAKELPIEQIIQMGLYLNPPLVPRCRQHMTQFHRSHTAACWRGAQPVEFPQLAAVDPERLKPLPCEFCTRVLPTPEAHRQHQQVAHKEEIGNLQAGRSLAVALNEKPAPAPQGGENAALLERLARLEAQLAERPATTAAPEKKPYHRECAVCGEAFDAKWKIDKHKQKAHKQQPEALSAPR